MELLLLRRTVAPASRGELFVDGELECFTLEDPVREISGQDLAAWKVPGRTAIPAGRYRLTLEDSPHFGPNTLTINDVPGFTGVRIHAGNTVADTEGCPLVGDVLEGDTIKGGTSAPALRRLKSKVSRAINMRGEEAWLTITNPSEGNPVWV